MMNVYFKRISKLSGERICHFQFLPPLSVGVSSCREVYTLFHEELTPLPILAIHIKIEILMK